MKAIINSENEHQIWGGYIPDDGESIPQCSWAWDKRTGEIYDTVVNSACVIGYARNRSELMRWLND